MNKKSVFIFEFISGGGFSKFPIPSSLFCEGFGMLKSIIADFKALGFEIVIILDPRVSFLSRFLQADIIKTVKPNHNYLKLFKQTIKECKYTFIIAPETSNILYELSKVVKRYDKSLLSANLKCINQSTSKIKTYKFFLMNDIPTPKTYKIPIKRKSLDFEFIVQKFKQLKCPIIIKPEDGVGAESIFYFEREEQILNFYGNSKDKIEQGRNYILQEYVEGRSLSLSLIGSPRSTYSYSSTPMILTINSQDIIIKNQNLDSGYYGGTTPLKNSGELINLLSKILYKIDFSEYEGYFGIDFVRTIDSSCHFIEINPRLTTSYLGVRNVINYNCAELIYNAKMNSLVDPEIKFLNFSLFSRIELQYKSSDPVGQLNDQLINKLMMEIPELVTPPVSFNNSNKFSCFIATKTNDLFTSQKRMNEILHYFKKLNFDVSEH